MSATNNDSVGRGSKGSKMLKDNKKVSRNPTTTTTKIITITANLALKKNMILNYFGFE